MNGQDIISYATGNEPIIPRSGVPGFDKALAVSLARLTNVFNVLPGFGYYDEGDESGNAYATKAARMQRDDGTVLFGERLLQELLRRAEAPDAAVLSVCAHEYGHIVQHKYGLRSRLLDNQSTVRKLELNADYFAGYFAGRRRVNDANFPAAVFALTQASYGDYNSTNLGHHGTPHERGAAVEAGFLASFKKKFDLEQAIADGLSFVGA